MLGDEADCGAGEGDAAAGVKSEDTKLSEVSAVSTVIGSDSDVFSSDFRVSAASDCFVSVVTSMVTSHTSWKQEIRHVYNEVEKLF